MWGDSLRDCKGRYAPGHPHENDGRDRDEAGRYRPERFDFLLVSDTHLGSKENQLTHLRAAYNDAKARGCSFAIHAGDVTDFDHMHKGSNYSTYLHGHDEVIDFVVNKYPRAGFQTYFCSGNHDHSGFNYSGTNVVKHICQYRDDFEYMGMSEAYFRIFGKEIFVYHGRGGGVYSSRLLKTLEYANAKGIYPDILICGHLHKYFEGLENGCKMFLAPCLQGQSLHFVESRLIPWIGYMIVHVDHDFIWAEPIQLNEIKDDYP